MGAVGRRRCLRGWSWGQGAVVAPLLSPLQQAGWGLRCDPLAWAAGVMVTQLWEATQSEGLWGAGRNCAG